MKFRMLFKNELSINLPASYDLNTEYEYLKEGKWAKYDNKHDIRLDKRPINKGGDQLHIKNRNGEEWTFRRTTISAAARSEPHKYTLRATNDVKDIVRKVFELRPKTIIECVITTEIGESNLVDLLMD